MNATPLCLACSAGYHAPFERFRKVAVHASGPTFLNLCKRCGALWHETLRDAPLVSSTEAMQLYPQMISLAEALAQKEGGDFEFEPPRMGDGMIKNVDFGDDA